MHQPTIPEGDEENEFGEPMTSPGQPAQPKVKHTVPADHETHPTSDDHHDEEPPKPSDELTPSDELEQPDESEKPGDDEQNAETTEQVTDGEETNQLGESMTSEGEQEKTDRLDESAAIEGIPEEGEQTGDEQAAGTDRTDQNIPTLRESPEPPTEDAPLLSPRAVQSDDHLKPEEPYFGDEHRRSAKSGRERSARMAREGSQVGFEQHHGEDEEEENIVPEEPEVKISREELLSRYQTAEAERDRLKGINATLQQRLADYLHKRKGAEDAPPVTHGGERSTAEQQQRYHKYLSEIESLQERIRRDQIDYERKQHEYHEQIDRKQRHVDQLKMEYVKLVKEIASKAVFARTGKTISNQEVEIYLTSLKDKEAELIKARHDNIRLKNQLRKRENQLKAKEQLAEGLHMIDFEQLKIENQTYSEKIEERNEELMKLRKKISTTVQILSHIKEKLAFVKQQRDQAEERLDETEKHVKQKRDELAMIKRRRDRLRQENQSLKQNSGLIGNDQLLRDYEDRYDEIERCTEKLEELKKRHAEITLMCKVMKKKIAKV